MSKNTNGKGLPQNVNIAVAGIAVLLVIITIIVTVIVRFTNSNDSTKETPYLEITEDGAVYLSPEYADIEYYLNEKRYDESEINLINSQAKEAEISAKEYVMTAMFINGSYDELFNSVDALKQAIKDIEEKHKTTISALYTTLEVENPLIDFVIRAKLSNKTETSDIDTLVIPEKINGITVKSVAPYAFFNCSFIKKIVFPESVTSVGRCAFENSTFTIITFESNDISIDITSIRNAASLERIEKGKNKYDILPSIEQSVLTTVEEYSQETE